MIEFEHLFTATEDLTFIGGDRTDKKYLVFYKGHPLGFSYVYKHFEGEVFCTDNEGRYVSHVLDLSALTTKERALHLVDEILTIREDVTDWDKFDEDCNELKNEIL